MFKVKNKNMRTHQQGVIGNMLRSAFDKEKPEVWSSKNFSKNKSEVR